MTDETETPEATATPAEAPAERRNTPKYSSVVYVHGIGSQRRYEETSRLVDSLDQFVRSQDDGQLVSIKARVEPLRPEARGEPGDVVGYIDTNYYSETEPRRRVRYYEAYWAPVMAGVSSVRGVLGWLFRQPVRPWRTLFSPWRERQRLRRARLVALFERGQRWPEGATRDDFQDLLACYGEFEKLDKQRVYPKGSFDEFLAFIAVRHGKNPSDRRRLETVARAWRAAYRADELRNMFVLTTMALLLLLLAGALITVVLSVLRLDFVLDLARAFRGSEDAGFEATVPLAVSILTLIASGLGLAAIPKDYLGDVEAWATYQETDVKNAARNETLERCVTTLTHVLNDPACARVTIVAHSLGTSIAHDALLALKRRNEAQGSLKTVMDRPTPLGKIEHFITLGSPIDKIEYFFESYSSYSHRFKRVVEQFRGDIGTAPFSNRRRPHIHWINYWDEGDIISGALHSPAGEQVYLQHVENVHVASYLFPAPGASHSGYFAHRTVISDLFDIIYRRRWSFVEAKEKKLDPRDFHRGDGEPRDLRVWLQVLTLFLPWLTLAGVIAWFAPGFASWWRYLRAGGAEAGQTLAPVAWATTAQGVAVWAWGIAGAILALLLIVAVIGKVRGHRMRIGPARPRKWDGEAA
jgi:hypothetical protein